MDLEQCVGACWDVCPCVCVCVCACSDGSGLLARCEEDGCRVQQQRGPAAVPRSLLAAQCRRLPVSRDTHRHHQLPRLPQHPRVAAEDRRGTSLPVSVILDSERSLPVLAIYENECWLN